MSPPPPSLAGKKVLVMGLGRFGGGVGVAQWLVQQGATVTVNDADPAEKLAASLQQLAGLPITFQLGGHRLEDFLAADLLVINPAVDKQKSPIVQQALRQGIPFTTEMNLFLQRNPALTIGITGSVGKSTTTTLIYKALKAALPSETGPSETGTQLVSLPHSPLSSVFLGGNIGKSLLLDLPRIRPNDLVVLELSSFMLEDTPAIGWSPNIALITNIFPNHLDRHDTLPAYAAAKQNILRFQTPADTAILNRDHEEIAQWAPLAKSRLAWFTTRPLAATLPLLIPGDHNQSNAQAALAVLDALEARNISLDRPAALHAITHFPGLAHRLQLVHTLTLPNRPPLRFFNDSKATTPDASLTALHAFPPRTAIFIVGGYDKHIDLAPFATVLAQRAAAVIGIGQTGESIINLVRPSSPLPPDRLAYTATLEAALPLALQIAITTPPITAIVLSPASASYGQFTNYEHRGQIFTTLAQSLK